VKAGEEALTAAHLKRIVDLKEPEKGKPPVFETMFDKFQDEEDHSSIFSAYNEYMEKIQADDTLSQDAKDWLREFLPRVYIILVGRLLKGATTTTAVYDKVSKAPGFISFHSMSDFL